MSFCRSGCKWLTILKKVVISHTRVSFHSLSFLKYLYCVQSKVNYAKVKENKQYVFKKGKSNKRKGFKGVQKHAKAERRYEKTKCEHYTFVGEDVVGEINPPPTYRAGFFWNLGACVVDTSFSDGSILEDVEAAQGYRLVSTESLSRKVCEENSYSYTMYLR